MFWTCALSNSFQKSCTPVKDLRLWDEYVGAVSGHHLSSTWRASYKVFPIGWSMYTLQFQTERGLSRSFFIQSEKFFLFWCASAYLDPDVRVSKCVTLGPYIYWNMLKYASIIFWNSRWKEGRRGWILEWFLFGQLSPHFWGDVKPRLMSFHWVFLVMKIFFH